MTTATKPACARLFEAEALRDGRLSGAEVDRYHAHLKVCSTCASEVEALQALANALRSSAPPSPINELHVRRERTRLLAAFDARLVAAPAGLHRNRRRNAVAALAVLSALAVTLAFVFSPSRRVAPVATSPAVSPEPVIVQADSKTQWSRRTESDLETITLQSGVLSIRVDHDAAAPPRRLLVILPDGELEDIGTAFSVTADAGHTTQVSVRAGSVVLRLHGKPPLALGAGDSWSPVPVYDTPAISAPARASNTSAIPAPAPASAPAASSSSPPPVPSARSPRATPALPRTAASAPDAFTDFRIAMSRLNSGDNAAAAAQFAAFVHQHPNDSRAEDAAYLCVLAWQRAGNSSATRRAATEYLARYPRGFRRAEVESLAR
ncbi:MAG TPA: FecR domain-containing protein [Polyangiaceae bacterium]|nr:FecR domain-containing protein [Polyangiaceae bacterium]